jgi:hypothetical protein
MLVLLLTFLVASVYIVKDEPTNEAASDTNSN